MEDDTIDVRSAQGQYTKIFCDSLENLDRQIDASLDGVAFELRDESEKPYGSRRRTPLELWHLYCSRGSALILLPSRLLNAHRNAFATRNDLLDALPELWENIRMRGGMDPINVPIIGAGFSRLNATREELVREIVKSFVAASHAGRFVNGLGL